MTIKELEEILGVPRATIRYYEKEGLINPERKRNDYREYSEDDISKLKKIIIFRKHGFSIREIEDILDGSVDLSAAAQNKIEKLQEGINEMNGALAVCRQVAK